MLCLLMVLENIPPEGAARECLSTTVPRVKWCNLALGCHSTTNSSEVSFGLMIHASEVCLEAAVNRHSSIE